jgi:hypothetical protein
VHAAGLEEDKGIYLWENLGAESLDAAAPAGLKRIETAQRHYALAGTLHLDHLAWLKKSPLGASVIQTNVVRLAESLKKPAAEVQSNLESLLSQHEKEWKSFVISLPPASFVRRWTVLQ